MKVTNFILTCIAVILSCIAILLSLILYDLDTIVEIVPLLAALLA